MSDGTTIMNCVSLVIEILKKLVGRLLVSLSVYCNRELIIVLIIRIQEITRNSPCQNTSILCHN
jgi:hypothetical protein